MGGRLPPPSRFQQINKPKERQVVAPCAPLGAWIQDPSQLTRSRLKSAMPLISKYAVVGSSGSKAIASMSCLSHKTL